MPTKPKKPYQKQQNLYNTNFLKLQVRKKVTSKLSEEWLSSCQMLIIQKCILLLSSSEQFQVNKVTCKDIT